MLRMQDPFALKPELATRTRIDAGDPTSDANAVDAGAPTVDAGAPTGDAGAPTADANTVDGRRWGNLRRATMTVDAAVA